MRADSPRIRVRALCRLVDIANDYSQSPLARFNPIKESAQDQDPSRGIVVGGISYAYTCEALRYLESLAQEGMLVGDDGAAVEKLPSYRIIQIGTPYPFPTDRVAQFAQGLDEIIVFEELDHVLEDEMLKLAGRIHASSFPLQAVSCTNLLNSVFV